MAAENVQTFTDSNFEETVMKAGQAVLVDFWAEWCGPCKRLGPTIEALATEYQGKLKVAKLDVDNNQQVSMQYGIRSIPTLLIFKGGKVVEQVVGAVPKKILVEKVSKHLN